MVHSTTGEDGASYYRPVDIKKIRGTPFRAGFVSLCSGGGVGDIGIEASLGKPRLAVAVERDPSRVRILQANYPKARVIQGDISERKTKSEIYSAARSAFGRSRPFAVLMTPPCQGWSPSGQARLRRNGEWRSESDPRNLVVSHCLRVVARLQPCWVVFENVPHVRVKRIRLRKRLVGVVDYIRDRLETMGYVVHESPMGTNAANFGIPQGRPRIFLVGERYGVPDDLVFPRPTHRNPRATASGNLLPAWPTLGEALGPRSPRGRNLLGKLDARHPTKLRDPTDPFHRIPASNLKHLAWMQNVPEGATAFDNSTCPACGGRDPNYNWRSHATCAKCGSALNKPLVFENGRWRVIKGRRTSYRRMRWDKPAPTVTCTSDTLSSDTKVHPTENRVLSLREIMILQTADEYPYRWDVMREPYRVCSSSSGAGRHEVTDGLLRTIIGEAIPPRWAQALFDHLWTVDRTYRRLNGGRSSSFRKDMFSPEKRRAIMRSIRSKNTQFERRFRSVLWRKGLRGYRLHWKPAGSADLAWPGLKVAVFLDSDFWHGWNWKKLRPKLKNRFWIEKIEKTMKRDATTTARLRRQGWIVLRFWGHELTTGPDKCASRIKVALDERRRNRTRPPLANVASKKRSGAPSSPAKRVSASVWRT